MVGLAFCLSYFYHLGFYCDLSYHIFNCYHWVCHNDRLKTESQEGMLNTKDISLNMENEDEHTDTGSQF